MKDALVRGSLLAALIVPLLYYGMQLVAVQFYPGYNFVTQSASELGSNRSNRPAILNSGAMLTGLAIVIGAFGIRGRLRVLGTPAAIAWVLFVALISAGAGGLWAGSFPLPDPRHNPRWIGAGTFLLPLLFAAAFWKSDRGGGTRRYLIANAIVFLLLIPVMAEVTGLPIQHYRGVMQRVAAAIVYLPIGVVAAFLLRARLTRAAQS
jgi:hypothetical membrane protein